MLTEFNFKYKILNGSGFFKLHFIGTQNEYFGYYLK